MENNNPNPEVSHPEIPASPIVVSHDPTFNKPKSKRPIFIIGIIIFIIIALSVVGFFVFRQQMVKTTAIPTPSTTTQKQPASAPIDPTSNWKTFKGNGYSFRYPLDWKLVSVPFLDPKTGSSSETVYTLRSPDYKDEITNPDEPVGVTANGSYVKWYFDSRTIDIEPFKNLQGYEEKKISNVLWYSYESDVVDGVTTYYILNEKNKSVTFTKSSPHNSKTENEFVIRQILSTFKFQ